MQAARRAPVHEVGGTEDACRTLAREARPSKPSWGKPVCPPAAATAAAAAVAAAASSVTMPDGGGGALAGGGGGGVGASTCSAVGVGAAA